MITGLCPRCVVGMYPDAGPSGHIWFCGDCGYETARRAAPRIRRDSVVTEIERERLNGVSGAVATTVTAAPVSWDRAARTRLEVLVRAIGGVDTLKREAAVIHQALTALGENDLPALAWAGPATPNHEQARRMAPTAIRRADVLPQERDRYRTAACVVCGYTFRLSTEMSITRQGSICRSVRMCNERQAAGGEGAA